MNASTPPPLAAARPTAQDGDVLDLERLWTIIRRNLPLVGFCILAGMFLGFLYLRAASPIYAAESKILLDEDLGTVGLDTTPAAANIQLDNRIASQIELLRSQRLALEVVDELKLADDPVFLSPPSSPLAPLLSPLRQLVAAVRGPQENELESDGGGDASATVGAAPGSDKASSERAALRRGAAQAVQQGLVVQRVERSTVILVSYQSHDPRLAFRVTDALVNAFLQERNSVVGEAAAQATGWMSTRLTELADQQRHAAVAVEEFRARNNLPVAQGELISEQRLSGLTGQLALGQSEVAQAQARAEQLKAVLAAGNDAAIANAALSVTDVEDPVVQQLQGRYADMSGRIEQISKDFGADHPQAVQLARERASVSAQLVGELRRLSSRLDNEYEVAGSRQTALEEAVSRQTGLNAQAGTALVKLRELEQRSTTLNTLYGNFLSRYEEAIQQRNFPISNFRVISAPDEPERPVGPRFLRTIAVFAFLGMMAGAGVGAVREFNERAYRIGSEIAADTGVRFLGYLPLLAPGGRSAAWVRRARRSGQAKPVAVSRLDENVFDETLRNVIHEFASLPIQGRQSRVIGVASALPGEGKSTTATRLARLAGQAGLRVLLVDADFRHPALNGLLNGREAEGGLSDAIRSGNWRPLVREVDANVWILPTLDNRDATLGGAILSSPGMARLFTELSACYDYVIVDLPPLGPVMDAKAVAPLTDGLLLVVRWGRTARSLVRSILEDEPTVRAKVVGAVLNQTDLSRLRSYGERGSRERAYREYSQYHMQS